MKSGGRYPVSYRSLSVGDSFVSHDSFRLVEEKGDPHAFKDRPLDTTTRTIKVERLPEDEESRAAYEEYLRIVNHHR